MTDRGFLSRWELILPASLGAAAETLLLRLLGLREAAALAPQVSAPPPFDLFHDLRWFAVYHDSWWLLAVELIGIIGLRALYAAWVLQRSWPGGDPPSMWTAFKRALVFYAAALILLSPWVVLLFGLAVTHVSFLFFVALPGALAVILLVPQGALSQAAGHWWRWSPSFSSAGWMLGAFVWLTAAGAAAQLLPLYGAVLVAAGAGLLNARASYAIVCAIVARPERTLALPRRTVPISLAVLFVVVVGGAAAGFGAVSPERDLGTEPVEIDVATTGRPLIVAGGFNSRWDPHPDLELAPGYVAWRYSYAGLDEEGRLLPYRPEDTLQPLVTSARKLDQQVKALAAAYGKPVTVVAESEGALVARTYLLRLYEPQSDLVDEIIILSMPIEPQVYFPEPGRGGWGLGTGWGLRALGWIIRNLGPLEGSPDEPFFRDLVECRALARDLAAAPPPEGIESAWFVALADAANGHRPDPPTGVSHYVVAATHGGLIRRARVRSIVGKELEDEPVDGSQALSALMGAVAHASAPWNVPPLVEGMAPSRDCFP